MKKLSLIFMLLLFSFAQTNLAFADAAEGDVLLILGENLNETQKKTVLAELNPPKDALEVIVTNQEEHQYLGNYISKAQIGTKALSSATITIGKKGSGISVTTNHINWVSNDMYTNALITAGVKDATIHITAPFDVSGTAALTGLIKAYEVATDYVIPEEQKQVANEEMVKTAQLAEELGADETNSLMTNIKEEIAKQKPKTEEEVQTIVQNASEQAGITLTDAQTQSLVDLFNKIKDLNIDWNAVGEQLTLAKEKFTNFIESEQGQTLINNVKEFFTTVWDAIKGFFGSVTDGDTPSETTTP